MDWQTFWINFFMALPPTLAALGTLIVSLRNSKKTDEIKEATNGMKDALVQSAHREGKAEGVKEEKAEGVARDKAAHERGKEVTDRQIEASVGQREAAIGQREAAADQRDVARKAKKGPKT